WPVLGSSRRMPPSSAGLTPKGGVVNNRRRAMAFSRTLQWDQPAPTQPIRAVTLRASTHQLRIFARDPQGSHGPALTGERPTGLQQLPKLMRFPGRELGSLGLVVHPHSGGDLRGTGIAVELQWSGIAAEWSKSPRVGNGTSPRSSHLCARAVASRPSGYF